MEIIVSSFPDMGMIFSQAWFVFGNFWFVIFPPLFYSLFMYLWMDSRIGKFSGSISKVLLEIIPPRDSEKSPQLMEALFDGIAGTDKGFLAYEKFIQGAVPFTMSFEIVGDSGSAHFYIRTPIALRNLVEAHLYAQYPDVEIVEVEDYVESVPKNIPNKEWDLWGTDFQLVRPDAYPIKTYHYFGESVTGKMIDPLAGLIEVIGKLGPDQKIWLQYIISPERPSWYNTGKSLVDEMVKGAKPKVPGLMSDIMGSIGGFVGSIFRGVLGLPEPVAAEKKESKLDPIEFRLTPVQRKVLEALEANVGKNVFKVKMRLICLGKKSNFDKTFVSAFVGGIKQFNDSNLNGFAPNDDSKTAANYFRPEERLAYRQRRIYRRYRDRDRDPGSNTFILSTSELATVFHVPDSSVVAPALTRVSAKRGGAPANLPVQ